ncbi:hypothetical protein KKE03_05275 [Patescibacteria group bacterium]|nr:hypothetical protein [Patescibacteria group bacterium]
MIELDQFLSANPQIDFGIKVAKQIARTVKPVYGNKQKDVPINEISHDFNYVLDAVAEGIVKASFQRAWRKRILYGYVTEDQGKVIPPDGKPDWIFLIDPVDGSRPANIGAEMACVNIAIIRGDINNPTLADVEGAVVLAIKERKMLVARKGFGVHEVAPATGRNAALIEIKAKENVTSQLKDVSLVYETYSMSAELTGIVIDPLLEEVSFKTEYPSDSYSALSLVRGQNELHVDLRRRLVLDYPYLPVMLKPNSKALGPMDIAPEFLILKELGMVVTDAHGVLLDKARLWKFNSDGSWSDDIQLSWIVAATPVLHQQAMNKIEKGFANLSKKYPRL